MSKPKPIVVPSDDYAVTQNGETFHPHEGETVTMYVGQAVGVAASIRKILGIGPQLDAAEGARDEQLRQVMIGSEALEQLCAVLAPRVVDWTWTDFAGRPLPKPDGTAGPLLALETSELFWLLTAVKGETPSARKNGSRRSPTT